MALLSISASLQRACCCTESHHLTKKPPQQQQLQPKTTLPSSSSSPSSSTSRALKVVTGNVQGQRSLNMVERQPEESSSSFLSQVGKPENGEAELKKSESSVSKFVDERWKKGTWDLNMFVKNGRMDWDAVIVAEARRRKFLELYPESATNDEPVVFRSSIIPWWTWLTRSYLPQAELLNGRAAMVGFFMSYIIDALTGLDVVGQSGNIICKIGMFATVIGIILFRKSEDFKNLKTLADEATLYDKQWRSSWEHHRNESSSSSGSGLNDISKDT